MVPTEIVSDAGLKAKEPLLSVVIVTVCVAPVGAVVAVGVGPFELLGVPLEPPQAARMKSTPTMSRENMGNCWRGERLILCMIISLSMVRCFGGDRFPDRCYGVQQCI